MYKFALTLLSLLLTGCASDGNANVSFGIGSFGSSGGVGVSGSTDVPVGGHKNPPPFEQLWLSPAVVEAVFPDKQLPFTAEEADINSLNDYAKSNVNPNVSAADKEIISACRSGKARCRVQLQDARTESTSAGE
jgi:hypothetical protein